MSSEARLAPSDRSSTDKRASISLATRSLGGTLDMGLVSSPVFSSANHFRGTRPFPFYRHSRTLPGLRNGYKRRHIDCAEGRLEIEVPQIRGVQGVCQPASMGSPSAPYRRTRTIGRGNVRAGAVDPGHWGCAARTWRRRGLPAVARQRQPAKRAAVGGVRGLQRAGPVGFDVVYLFADGVYESVRQQAGLQQAILVTWAILRDGCKVLLHMSLGSKESERDWLEHYRSLVRRGLRPPLTVTTDGAPGLIKAVETMWPEAERIRCWVHKMRNILDKVPEEVRPELKAHLVA